jgi:hypothetical protein
MADPNLTELADDAAIHFASQVNALQAEVRRLTADVEFRKEQIGDLFDGKAAAERERDAALVTLATVIEALRPFAHHSLGGWDSQSERQYRIRVTEGQVARAGILVADLEDHSGFEHGARIVAALRYYADIKNYDDEGRPGKLVGGGWAGTEPQDADWEAEYGERARKALGLPDPWQSTSDEEEQNV